MQPHYLVQTRYLFTTQKLAKESTLSKIKQMIRDYWYVIIPVEVVTSVMWYGGFFLMLKSGVDIVQLLTNIGVSEQTLSKLPAAGGDAGYHALAFICYKVISPVRHGLSLAISAAIVARMEKTSPGYLKTSSQIVQEAKETGDDLKGKYNEKVAEGRERYDEMKSKAKETTDDFKEKYNEKMTESREKYDEMKAKAQETYNDYNDKMSESREKYDEMKEKAKETKEDLKVKYNDWKKVSK